MAKRNIESGNNKVVERNGRISNNNNNIKGAGSPCNRIDSPRVSPSKMANSSPRTSPGLLAGHYAGCKWTEPPSPSALPLPPQHWMQSPSSKSTSTKTTTIQGVEFININKTSNINHSKKLLPFANNNKSKSDLYHHDISSQLKVLLKVQA